MTNLHIVIGMWYGKQICETRLTFSLVSMKQELLDPFRQNVI